jgi:ATP-binding cassette, subfamily B, bacterial
MPPTPPNAASSPGPTGRARAWREARRAIALVWESAPGLTVCNAVLSITLSLAPLAGLYLLKLLLEHLASGAVDRSRVLALVAAMGGVALVTAIARSLSHLVGELQIHEVADHVKTLLHAKSIEVDLEYYENSSFHDTVRRAQSEAPVRPTRIVNSLVQVAQNGLSLLAIGALLVFTLHWGFFAVLLAAAVPALWVRARYSKETFELQRKQTSTERALSYVDLTITHEAFAKELRLFGLGPLFSKRSQALRAQLRGEKSALAKRRAAREIVTEIFMAAAIYGSLAFIAVRAFAGAISLGSLVMYFLAIQRAQTFLQSFLSGLNALYENHLFLRNLSEFLDLSPKIGAPSSVAKPIPRPIREGIAFQNVSFTYPGKQTPVLEDISFAFRPGEKIALVGENGSGKTTLVKLLCRLYDPTAGKLLLDGIDARELNVDELRRQFSVIFQDFARYQLTIAENIGLGDTAKINDRPGIVAAAQAAGADEFIQRYSRNYDAPLGRVFSDGEDLSGGEWQKIGLARAFLRDAPFLIMDEPTSAMDPRSEYEMFKKFAELASGRAALLISHRLSTVRMADTILMLERGRIVERGSHDQLIAQGGAYARLFEMQAKSYR